MKTKKLTFEELQRVEGGELGGFKYDCRWTARMAFKQLIEGNFKGFYALYLNGKRNGCWD